MKRHLFPTIALLALASLAGYTQPGAAARDPLYAAWLQTETAALPGDPQLAIDGADLAAFSRPASEHARSEIVEIAGQPFGQAIRVHVLQPVQPVYQVQLTTPNTRLAVKKGDTLLVVYHARCLEAKTESGGGSARGYLQLDRPPWTGTGAIEANPGRDWQKRYARFTATQDYPAGSLHLTFHLGQAAQVLEFGGLALLNFGPQVDLAKLPVSRITYAGREADAPWRQAAAERIERHRKGNLRVEVVDAHGQPRADVPVRARMTRHAYQFGTFLERPALAQTPDGERYRETVKRLFNRVTCPWYWADWGWPKQEQDYLALSQWAMDNKLHRRSHTLIWPDWRWTPAALRQLEGDPAALRRAVHDSIAARVRLCRPFDFDDYDVVNELRDNHTIVDLLGKPILVEWFKLVKALDPKAKPGINEYAILAGGGHTEKEQAIYEGHIQYLLDQGAPLEVIGFQCHFGEDLTPPAQVMKILDRFARFGLPLHATEFDISTNDEEAQGDYLRDFLTVFFSHPATEAITQWGFWEGQHWIPRAALFRKDWSVKPNGRAYLDLVLNDWWTDVIGKTDAQGVFTTRGFLGYYEVVVGGAGGEKTVSVALARPGTSAKVVY